MKKIILALTLLVASITFVNAQISDKALGIRTGGGNYGFGGEISYQHGLSDVNRIELDLGWGSVGGGWGYRAGYTAITGIYHWVFNLDGGLNWYIGPGAQLLLFSSNWGGGGMAAGLGGQLGIEYNFNGDGLPLQVGLDTRPMFLFNSWGNGFGWGGALSVRYTF